ncbi:MAG: hypothetical protein KDB22_09405 [Planctomycetales bacterium]|nr:hypothetical protein [Planctomycetales bacterium]
MKQLTSLAVAVVVAFAATVNAEELKSGLKQGEAIGAFDVVKCAGEEADEVAIGEKLCYRCRNGARPQVMVFTRSSDKKVVKLVSELDAHVKKYEENQLRAFVSMLGDSRDAASDAVKKLAKTTKTEKIPYVVPAEFENGPDNYGLNPKAEVTVIIANESKVVANFAVASAKDLDIEAVLAGVKKMLN